MKLVTPIENGTVIDHIPSGNGYKVLRALKGLGEHTFILAAGVDSKKRGKKDLLKIKDKELAESEYNLVSLFAPEATINIIKSGKIAKKEQVRLPEEFSDVLECSNPNCITKSERFYLSPRFTVISKKPLRVKCQFCETILDSKKIVDLIRNK